MNRKFQIFICLALGLVITATAMGSINITHVGGINEGLYAPSSLAVHGNNLAVLEPFSQQLKIFTPDGIIRQAIHITGRVQALQPISESIYLYCDRNRRAIMAIDVELNAQSEFVSGINYADPTDILIYDNNLYVLDGGAGEIIVVDMQGNETGRFAIVDSAGLAISFASSFACNTNGDVFYIISQTTSEVWVISSDGSYLTRFGSFGVNDGQITRGGEILFSADGFIYVSDRYQNRVIVFTETGEFVDNIDLSQSSSTGGALTSGLAIDDDGLLYVASTEGAEIVVYHVEKTGDDVQVLTAEQLYPPANETIDHTGVILSAQIQLHDVASETVHFDFRLFLGNEEATSIMEITGLEPTSHDPDMGLWLAQWDIEEPLTADTLYGWKVRVYAGETTGPWSNIRNFRTASLPRVFRLDQNFPNPFNPETHISFSIPEQSLVRLTIINILGQQARVLRDEPMEPGEYEAIWDGKDDYGLKAASGVYFYRLTAGNLSQTRKMVLLK